MCGCGWVGGECIYVSECVYERKRWTSTLTSARRKRKIRLVKIGSNFDSPNGVNNNIFTSLALIKLRSSKKGNFNKNVTLLFMFQSIF